MHGVYTLYTMDLLEHEKEPHHEISLLEDGFDVSLIIVRL